MGGGGGVNGMGSGGSTMGGMSGGNAWETRWGMRVDVLGGVAYLGGPITGEDYDI